MYNKIASLILNSGKATGVSDVYVAQPDALKENLAGKIFILGEIGDRKSEARRVFDFLIERLNDNYYNDEKILLRGKIEGLKIENIFEAALAKTNKDFSEFLITEKIKLNSAASLTLGVVYENKLHFSSFGKNRALLIYARGEQYEIINVETNAETVPTIRSSADNSAPQAPPLFSSVISGEIPLNSYFIFTSEALPEYLSAKEMLAIVTKLPPIVAVEQIKNTLAKINDYIPFLAVLIKNTAGLNLPEPKEELEESPSAHGSISSMNYTEQKTERMLAPAGLISLSKIIRNIKGAAKKVASRTEEKSKKRIYVPEKEPAPVVSSLDLGKVKSLNLARSDSFMLKEKIFFKKRAFPFWPKVLNFFQALASLFERNFWTGLLANLRSGLKNLSFKNRWMVRLLAAVILIFIFSLLIGTWQHKKQVAQTTFDNLAAQIDSQEGLIDAHLLYNDQVGAQTILLEVQPLLTSLVRKTTIEQNTYNRLLSKLTAQTEKIQKIVKPNTEAKVADLSGLGVSSIIFTNGKIYAAGGGLIYSPTLNSTTTSKWTVAGATNLINPTTDNKSLLYYWDNNKVFQFNYKTASTTALNMPSLDSTAGLTSFKVFNGNLYIIAKTKNQIYKYNSVPGGFGPVTLWLKDTADFSQATDLAIDGSVYVLKANGEVLKFYKNKAADYKAAALSPAMTGASKIIVGTKYLYIFEASSKRLAVLLKADGTLANQYQVSTLNQPKDVAIDEAGKTAYFLDGDAVYKVALNQ